jgi:peptidoglycan hydrolase CwlO-like protein
MDYESELKKRNEKVSSLKNEIAQIKVLIREEIESTKNRITQLNKLLDVY